MHPDEETSLLRGAEEGLVPSPSSSSEDNASRTSYRILILTAVASVLMTIGTVAYLTTPYNGSITPVSSMWSLKDFLGYLETSKFVNSIAATASSDALAVKAAAGK